MSKILGEKVEELNGRDIYIYPEIKLTEEEEAEAKNILMCGPTGTGKTTFIQGFVNAFNKVKFDDKYRYRIGREKEEQSKLNKVVGCSVTDDVTIYILKRETKKKKLIFRLIDAPGYGDTRGEKMDEKIMEEFLDVFAGRFVHNIHAICFTSKFSETRLDERMKKIMEKVLTMFGKNVKDILVFLFTFAEIGQKPEEAINILCSQDSPFNGIITKKKLRYYLFQNNTLFNESKKENDDDEEEQDEKDSDDDEEDSESDDDDTSIDKKTYKFTMKNYKKFVNFVKKSKGISLKDSEKVLVNRKRIKAEIDNSIRDTKNMTTSLVIMENNNKYIIEKEKELQEINKKLEDPMKITVPRTRERKTYETKRVTSYFEEGSYCCHCKKCDRDCHYNCKFKKESWFPHPFVPANHCNLISGGKCTACGCESSVHEINNYYYEYKNFPKTVTETYYETIDAPDKQAAMAQNQLSKNKLNEELAKLRNESITQRNNLNQSLCSIVVSMKIMIKKNDELQKDALYPGKNVFEYCKERFIFFSKDSDDRTRRYLNKFTEQLENVKSICYGEANEQMAVQSLSRFLSIEL